MLQIYVFFIFTPFFYMFYCFFYAFLIITPIIFSISLGFIIFFRKKKPCRLKMAELPDFVIS
jgi:hypothetical protein